jgi:hypothetical protein
MLGEPGIVNDVIVIVKGRRLVRHRANNFAMTLSAAQILASFDENTLALYTREMRRNQKITADEEAEIVKRLRRTSHASFVACKTGFSFATVWRVAEAAGIELTEGRRAKGHKRLSPKKRTAVLEARRRNPDAPQIEIAAEAGVSRSTVWRVEGGSPRRRRAAVAVIG